ncbi:glycosyltransferase [Pyruvatibacter mobilis]|uniref:glycosyltransferase n=1 Tax=Pyruvatibacter mobilis TaxID=1712261 RepID=UPI003BAC3675
MYKSKSVCVVVPCFNEGSQIGLVVRTMPSIVDKIIIVDDKSTDETVQIALKLKDEDSRIVVIEHTENQGVGGGDRVRLQVCTGRGFRHGRSYGRGWPDGS